MERILRELYVLEVDQARLDFEADPAYQTYLTQSEALWQGQDMPEPIFRLLDTGNYISFAHGFRLGLRLASSSQNPLHL